ncbi:MAG: DUF4419 domain-containing protein [Desulfuromonadaceae bacterium]
MGYMANQITTRRNPYLQQSPKDKTGFVFADFPGGLSKAEFEWHYYSDIYKMDFLAGFIGVSQDIKTKTLRPEIGWAVRDTTTSKKPLRGKSPVAYE